MKIIIYLSVILLPFLFTYLVKEVANAAKKYLRYHPRDTKITQSKINWVYVLTIIVSSLISCYGMKSLSMEIIPSIGNSWQIWIMVSLLGNMVVTMYDSSSVY